MVWKILIGAQRRLRRKGRSSCCCTPSSPGVREELQPVLSSPYPLGPLGEREKGGVNGRAECCLAGYLVTEIGEKL
ncbi:hypothetical protein MRX96_023453 [Rhipicephalus microplus]